MKADVVITDVTDLDVSAAVGLLEREGLTVEVVADGDPDTVASAASEAQALIVGYARIDAALLERLPSLRIVATMSAGFDMVDTDAARDAGIWVANIPQAATEEVAVHAVAGMLAMLRCLPQYTDAVDSGAWADSPPPAPPRPSTLTLGLLGLGKIGGRVASLAGPFFGRVIAHDPWLSPEQAPAGVELVSLEDLAAQSDVLSLHSPLTDANRYIVDAAFIRSMPERSYIVNVARGGLIDEAALADALRDGTIAGAALDVFEVEPPSQDNPLLHDPRVITSPHAAYRSAHSLQDYVLHPVRNILAWRASGTPLNPVVEGTR
jgi:D-3-phosphoglycerate dehydrogenase